MVGWASRPPEKFNARCPTAYTIVGWASRPPEKFNARCPTAYTNSRPSRGGLITIIVVVVGSLAGCFLADFLPAFLLPLPLRNPVCSELLCHRRRSHLRIFLPPPVHCRGCTRLPSSPA